MFYFDWMLSITTFHEISTKICILKISVHHSSFTEIILPTSVMEFTKTNKKVFSRYILLFFFVCFTEERDDSLKF